MWLPCVDPSPVLLGPGVKASRLLQGQGRLRSPELGLCSPLPGTPRPWGPSNLCSACSFLFSARTSPFSHVPTPRTVATSSPSPFLPTIPTPTPPNSDLTATLFSRFQVSVIFLCPVLSWCCKCSVSLHHGPTWQVLFRWGDRCAVAQQPARGHTARGRGRSESELGAEGALGACTTTGLTIGAASSGPGPLGRECPSSFVLCPFLASPGSPWSGPIQLLPPCPNLAPFLPC